MKMSFALFCRYVEVNENQICCVDDTQDRVNVGIGDMCCGSVPYSSNGAQTCCDGKRALNPEKKNTVYHFCCYPGKLWQLC